MDNKPFTDRVKITVKAGNGGDGMNSFQAYKGKPACGPDGGDGGNGGSVYFLGDRNMHDLLSFRFTSKYFAGNGARGGTNRCTGKQGEDMVIKVPLGTLVRDAEQSSAALDVFEDGEKLLLLAGGRGGKGNVRFTTARRHAPDFAQKGVLTKPHELILEMKVIADVGLVGFPNVGKSTLLSKISAAKPKIADYHFTTLSPNLGVVRVYDESFICADIPGLIEGAAEGAGLGHAFLRHIERTRMIVHVVDISGMEGRDPVADFAAINEELRAISESPAARPPATSATAWARRKISSASREAYGEKYRIFSITALRSEGLDALLSEIVSMLRTLPPAERIPVEEFEFDEGDTRPVRDLPRRDGRLRRRGRARRYALPQRRDEQPRIDGVLPARFEAARRHPRPAKHGLQGRRYRDGGGHQNLILCRKGLERS